MKDQLNGMRAKVQAYNDAITELLSNNIETYWLDTGQTSQKVTKLNIDILEKQIDSLMNRCATLEIRLCGGGSTHVRPIY
jgi:predicted CoA-binding protein